MRLLSRNEVRELTKGLSRVAGTDEDRKAFKQAAQAIRAGLRPAIRPPPPDHPVSLPELRPWQPESESWRKVQETSVETVRPPRRST